MTIRAVGSSAFSCATTIVTVPPPLGLYVAWKMPIDGVYDAAASAVTASASATAQPRTVKRTDLFMAPSLVVSPAVLPARRRFWPESCIAKHARPFPKRNGTGCLLRLNRVERPRRHVGAAS